MPPQRSHSLMNTSDNVVYTRKQQRGDNLPLLTLLIRCSFGLGDWGYSWIGQKRFGLLDTGKGRPSNLK